MGKNVIAISGPTNQGKSATVKLVATTLDHLFPNAQKQVINNGPDITFVFEINGIKVGIESQGDPYSRLMTSLPHFAQLACDIIVCATRTSGMTVDAVNDLHAQHGYDIIWATNYRSWQKNHDQINQLSAVQVVDIIQLIMNGQL